MTKYAAFALLCTVALSTAACSSAKKQLGLTRQSPDEFSVVERAPLSLPPDYTLRPPRAGGPIESNTQAPQAEARRVVLGTATDSQAPQTSTATDILLQKAGARQVQPNIRSTLDKETTVISTQNKTVAEKLLFWDKDQPAVTPAEELDAKTEAQRLNKQGIQSPTPGQYRPPQSVPPKQ